MSVAGGGLLWLWAPPPLPATVPATFALEFYLGGSWRDFSSRLMGFESAWGREDEFSGVQPAVLRLLLDDDDGVLDPQWTAGPWYGQLDLNTPVRLSATRDGLRYPLGYGYLTDFTPQPTTLGANLQLTATDEFQHLTGKQITGSFAAELESARIHWLLANVPFSGVEDFSPGLLPLPGITLTDTALTTHLDQVLQASLGLFWFGPDGRAVYRNRQQRMASASVAHFGAGGDYPVREVHPFYNRAGLVNQARMTRGGGAGGVNAVQQITVATSPPAGWVWLSFRGATTVTLPSYATVAAVLAALQALPTIGAGNITCSGGPWPGQPINVTFVGTLAQQAVPLLSATTTLPAGSVTVTELTAGAVPLLQVNDTASQAKYGVETYVGSDDLSALLPSDAERTSWLTWLVAQHATPQTRASELLVDPYLHTGLWARALGSDLGTRITVTHDLPGSRGIVDVDYYVEGITHRAVLAGTPDYSVTWRLSRGSYVAYWWLDRQVQLGVETRLSY